MQLKINRKMIISVISIIFLLSALIYNLLYINKQKNIIVEEITLENEKKEKELPVGKKRTIFVDVSGEVNTPGLYELNEGSRVNDAIEIAGGVMKDADLTDVNLAYILTDAIKITIPKKEQKKQVTTISVKKPVVAKNMIITKEEKGETSKVNINTATKDQFMTLSGIGEVTAEKIIKYREENGKFITTEAIKNVSGIGDSKYNLIKEKLTV